MPFESDRQRRYLYAKKPSVAKKLAHHEVEKSMDLVEINKAFFKVKPKVIGTPRPTGDPAAWMKPGPRMSEGELFTHRTETARRAKESLQAQTNARDSASRQMFARETRDRGPHHKLVKRTPTNAGAFPWNG